MHQVTVPFFLFNANGKYDYSRPLLRRSPDNRLGETDSKIVCKNSIREVGLHSLAASTMIGEPTPTGGPMCFSDQCCDMLAGAHRVESVNELALECADEEMVMRLQADRMLASAPQIV